MYMSAEATTSYHWDYRHNLNEVEKVGTQEQNFQLKKKSIGKFHNYIINLAPAEIMRNYIIIQPFSSLQHIENYHGINNWYQTILKK